MQSTVIPVADVLQIVAIISVVTIWLVTAPRLNSPWIPSSNMSHVAVLGLVFLYFWSRFVAEILFLGEPVYFWYGLILIIGIIGHWARISSSEPSKRSEPR